MADGAVSHLSQSACLCWVDARLSNSERVGGLVAAPNHRQETNSSDWMTCLVFLTMVCGEDVSSVRLVRLCLMHCQDYSHCHPWPSFQ